MIPRTKRELGIEPELYIRQCVADEIDVGYYKRDDAIIRLHPHTLLSLSESWDADHRALFAHFIERGDRMECIPQVIKNQFTQVPVQRPGWWKVINYKEER